MCSTSFCYRRCCATTTRLCGTAGGTAPSRRRWNAAWPYATNVNTLLAANGKRQTAGACTRENLQGIFPDNCFQRAVEQLAVHGANFRLLRHVETNVNDQGGYLMGVRIDARTLYCTTKGFEVYLRWTFARDSDPESSMSSASDEATDID